jgi:hypothetical protein
MSSIDFRLCMLDRHRRKFMLRLIAYKQLRKKNSLAQAVQLR